MRVRTRHPGDPLNIRSAEWNAIARVVNRATSPLDQLGSSRQVNLPPGVVLVKNNQSQAMIRHEVIALVGMVVDPAEQPEEYLRGVTLLGQFSDLADRPPGRYAVATESIPPGAIGRAIISGVHPIRANIVDETHRFLRTVARDVEEPETLHLESCTCGQVPILSQEEGDGIRHVLAAFVPATTPLTILARLTGAEPISGRSHQWEYEWEEVIRATDVYQAGTRNSEEDGLAYNLSEAGNAVTGLLGSGIDIANIPGGFAPVPGGEPVVRLSLGLGGTWEFEGWTHVDGICEEAEGSPVPEDD